MSFYSYFDENHQEIFAQWPHLEIPNIKYPSYGVLIEVSSELQGKKDRMATMDVIFKIKKK